MINDHSTIGIVVTTDGSFGEIKRRAGYIAAEETDDRRAEEPGKAVHCAFELHEALFGRDRRLAKEMAEKYGVPLLPVNCEQLKKDDITTILEKVLKEFPGDGDGFLYSQMAGDSARLPLAEEPGDSDRQRKCIKKVDHMKDVQRSWLPEEDRTPSGAINIRGMQMADGSV